MGGKRLSPIAPPIVAQPRATIGGAIGDYIIFENALASGDAVIDTDDFVWRHSMMPKCLQHATHSEEFEKC